MSEAPAFPIKEPSADTTAPPARDLTQRGQHWPVTTLKRYLVFAADETAGGWDDFQGMHASLQAAEAMAHYLTDDARGMVWAHIVDIATMRVVSHYLGRRAGPPLVLG